MELPHDALQLAQERLVVNTTQLSSGEVQDFAIACIQMFDSFAKTIESPNSWEEEGKLLPLVATEEGLRQIIEEAKTKRLYFNGVLPSTLLKFSSAAQFLRPAPR